MQLSTHHKLALAGATVTSSIALFDAATHGITGEYSIFADESGVRWALVLAALAHGLPYLAFCAVLVLEAPLIRSAGRVAAGLRWVLLVSMAILAVGFTFLAPFMEPSGSGPGLVFGAIATVGFAGMLLSALTIGPFLLTAPGLRPGSWVLCAMLPVLGLTFVLAAVATDWAHPAYLETVLHFGIALLGVDAVRRATDAGGSAAPGGLLAEVGVGAHPGVHGDRSGR